MKGPHAPSVDEVRPTVIDRFRGKHFFLSNFSPAVTPHRGHLFPSSEHAYMAARTDDPAAIDAILATSDPAEAQRIGICTTPPMAACTSKTSKTSRPSCARPRGDCL